MTREEAINLVKQVLPCLNIDEKIREGFETLIPELRESEDERMRKMLIDRIRSAEELTDELREWILTYLEKHKDILRERAQNIVTNMLEDRIEGIQHELIEFLSNTINASWFDIIKSADSYAERIKNIIEKQKEQKSIEDIVKDITKNKEVATKFLKSAGIMDENGELAEMYRSEQKPTEWSDTDNIGWDEAFACVTRAEKAAKNEEELQNAVTAEKWLKEIKFKYYVHPVKQMKADYYVNNRMQPVYDNQESFESALDKAWKSYNESGARTVDGCEDNYVECAHAKGFREGYLFGIEKQKDAETRWENDTFVVDCSKQKSTERSEKDDEIRKALIVFLEMNTGYFACNGFTKDDIIQWLKELRPSWKPSEEQMEALNTVLEHEAERVGSSKELEKANALYEQLQRL